MSGQTPSPASRLEQLSTLLTAMVAVVLTGQMPILVQSGSTEVEHAPFAPAVLTECVPGGRYAGIYTRVAKRLGISATSVKAVALGRMKSRRVVTALTEDLEALDLSLTKALGQPPIYEPRNLLPITVKEKLEFRRGGKYFGMQARVARRIGAKVSTVNLVAKGRTKSNPKILSAIRLEIASIDAVTQPDAAQIPALTPDEIASFQRGQKYYGAVRRVARNLNTNSGTLSSVMRGVWGNQRLLAAIRHEMARIDSELKAKAETANG